MKLDLSNYLDFEEPLQHMENILSIFAFSPFAPEHLKPSMEDSMIESMDWLNDNTPWLMPHLDIAVVNLFRAMDEGDNPLIVILI